MVEELLSRDWGALLASLVSTLGSTFAPTVSDQWEWIKGVLEGFAVRVSALPGGVGEVVKDLMDLF